MELLLNKLKNHDWEHTASNFNGSPIFEVNYGDDNEKLIFWNDSNDMGIDEDYICDKIAKIIEDEGLDIMNNSVEDGWNTICFEIYDNNY